VGYTGAGVGFQLERRDILLLVGLVSLTLLGRRYLGAVGPAVGEASAFLAMGLLLSRHAGVRATLRNLDPLPRALAILLPALLVAGQVLGRDDRLFPFVTWPLYTNSMPANPSYHEYTATLATGREIPLPVRSLFPTLGGRLSPFLGFLSSAALHAPGGPAQARAGARLDAVLRAMAREHERRHATGPILAIDVWHRTVPTAAYDGRSSITRRHDRRVETP
jgi:hypothetical protein